MEQTLSEKLDSIFSFQPSVSSVEQRIEEYSDKTSVIEAIAKTEIRTLQDAEYIREKLKSMIDVGEGALLILKAEMKLGAPASKAESFSYVFRELAVAIEKLQNLNKVLLDVENMANPVSFQQQNNFLVMDSKKALDLIRKAAADAKDKSEMNEIGTDFDLRENVE